MENSNVNKLLDYIEASAEGLGSIDKITLSKYLFTLSQDLEEDELFIEEERDSSTNIDALMDFISASIRKLNSKDKIELSQHILNLSQKLELSVSREIYKKELLNEGIHQKYVLADNLDMKDEQDLKK